MISPHAAHSFQRSMPHLQGLWTAAWLPPCLSAEADISYKVPLLYFRLQWPVLYRLFQGFSYICRLHISDTAVARTLDVTALYHIPYGYVIFNSIYFSHLSSPAPVHPTDTQAASKNGSACVRNRNCFPLMQRTAECRGSVCGCFHHRQARRSGLCVRIPYCYLLYLQQFFRLINTF